MPAVVTLVVLGLTLAPTGFYRFCIDQPRQCAVVAGSALPTVAAADAVNRRVNASIRPTAEAGSADVWKVGGATGDCEDYALAKRAALIRAGAPSSAVRIAAGVTPQGERHAVLVVTTPAGELVLDNLTDELLPVARARIRIKMVQSAGNPRIWQAVRN